MLKRKETRILAIPLERRTIPPGQYVSLGPNRFRKDLQAIRME